MKDFFFVYLQQKCAEMLVDKLLNKTHDLALGKYQFTADAGTTEGRFFIKLTQSYIRGDANGDGVVDVADVVAVVNKILGKASDNFNEEAANINGDDAIDVADVVGIVNIILGKNP